MAEARETAPPPTSVDGKDAFVWVCFVFSKDYNLLKSGKPLKKAVRLSLSFILSTWINKSLDTMYWVIKGFWKLKVSVQAKTHTWRASHTHISHTLLVCRMICLLTFPPTLVSIPSPEPERRWSCWGGEKGKQGLLEEEKGRGPIWEELLSGSRGQHKGRILVLESARGEEGWNHVSFILPPPPPCLYSPDWESINSFNPVFLWIRLAFWATAALFSNHSPQGAGGGLGSTVSEAKSSKW